MDTVNYKEFLISFNGFGETFERVFKCSHTTMTLLKRHFSLNFEGLPCTYEITEVDAPDGATIAVYDSIFDFVLDFYGEPQYIPDLDVLIENWRSYAVVKGSVLPEPQQEVFTTMADAKKYLATFAKGEILSTVQLPCHLVLTHYKHESGAEWMCVLEDLNPNSTWYHRESDLLNWWATATEALKDFLRVGEVIDFKGSYTLIADGSKYMLYDHDRVEKVYKDLEIAQMEFYNLTTTKFWKDEGFELYSGLWNFSIPEYAKRSADGLTKVSITPTSDYREAMCVEASGSGNNFYRFNLRFYRIDFKPMSNKMAAKAANALLDTLWTANNIFLFSKIRLFSIDGDVYAVENLDEEMSAWAVAYLDDIRVPSGFLFADRDVDHVKGLLAHFKKEVALYAEHLKLCDETLHKPFDFRSIVEPYINYESYVQWIIHDMDKGV